MNPLIMLAAYVAAMGAIAALAGKARNSLEFHVADRNMGTLKSALSIGTTWVWAPALFVSAERAYTQGVVGLFWFLAPNVLCLILFIPFAKRIRSLMPQGVTLSGYMGERYGTGAKRAYLFQLSVLSVSSTGVNLLAGASVLHIFTGLPFPLLTVILAAVAFSYTWVSGFKASVLTDGVQMALIAGVCLLLVSMSTGINGLESAIAGLTGPGGEYGRIFSRTGLEVFLAFGIPSAIGLLSGPFGDQNFWQRAFAIRRDRIGRSFALGAMFFAVVPLSMAFLGYTARGLGFAPENTGIVNLELVAAFFPVWALLPFALMMVSNLLSTVDGNICATASLTTDMTDSKGMAVPRIAMLANLVLGILIANIPDITITNLFLFYGTLRASTFAPTVLSLSGRRVGWIAQAVAASLFLGLPLFAWGTFGDILALRIAGSLTALLASGVVALIGGRHAKRT